MSATLTDGRPALGGFEPPTPNESRMLAYAAALQDAASLVASAGCLWRGRWGIGKAQGERLLEAGKTLFKAGIAVLRQVGMEYVERVGFTSVDATIVSPKFPERLVGVFCGRFITDPQVELRVLEDLEGLRDDFTRNQIASVFVTAAAEAILPAHRWMAKERPSFSLSLCNCDLSRYDASAVGDIFESLAEHPVSRVQAPRHGEIGSYVRDGLGWFAVHRMGRVLAGRAAAIASSAQMLGSSSFLSGRDRLQQFWQAMREDYDVLVTSPDTVLVASSLSFIIRSLLTDRPCTFSLPGKVLGAPLRLEEAKALEVLRAIAVGTMCGGILFYHSDPSEQGRSIADRLADLHIV